MGSTYDMVRECFHAFKIDLDTGREGYGSLYPTLDELNKNESGWYLNVLFREREGTPLLRETISDNLTARELVILYTAVRRLLPLLGF